MSRIALDEISWERMIRAVEKVRERLVRAAEALSDAGIPYAVAGGNAVAAWVSRVDEAAVRNTQDVDILIRREDLPAARTALESAGFVYRHVKTIDMFLDGPDAKARDAVHIVFAGENVKDGYVAAAPDVDESEESGADELEGLSHLDEVGVVADEGGGGAEVDDGSRVGSGVAEGVDVGHDVVAELFFVFGGFCEVDVFEVLVHLLELFGGDGQA